MRPHSKPRKRRDPTRHRWLARSRHRSLLPSTAPPISPGSASDTSRPAAPGSSAGPTGTGPFTVITGPALIGARAIATGGVSIAAGADGIEALCLGVLDDRDIRRVLVLHALHVVARIDVVHLAGDAAREIGEQV